MRLTPTCMAAKTPQSLTEARQWAYRALQDMREGGYSPADQESLLAFARVTGVRNRLDVALCRMMAASEQRAFHGVRFEGEVIHRALEFAPPRRRAEHEPIL